MIVDDLRKLLEGVDGKIQVIIPLTQEFDGAFYTPCPVDSGLCAMGTDPNATEEDIEELILLNKPVPEEDAFLLIPCGFGEEKDHKHELN